MAQIEIVYYDYKCICSQFILFNFFFLKIYEFLFVHFYITIIIKSSFASSNHSIKKCIPYITTKNCEYFKYQRSLYREFSGASSCIFFPSSSFSHFLKNLFSLFIVCCYCCCIARDVHTNTIIIVRFAFCLLMWIVIILNSLSTKYRKKILK